MKIIQPQILTYFLFSILLDFAHAENQDDLCYALSLSGGGAKGSYEVGALWQMARMLDEKEMQYDVVSGISVGGPLFMAQSWSIAAIASIATFLLSAKLTASEMAS